MWKSVMLRACLEKPSICKVCKYGFKGTNSIQVRGWRKSICGANQKLEKGAKPRCLKCGRTDCNCGCIPCPTCGRADPCKCRKYYKLFLDDPEQVENDDG